MGYCTATIYSIVDMELVVMVISGYSGMSAMIVYLIVVLISCYIEDVVVPMIMPRCRRRVRGESIALISELLSYTVKLLPSPVE